MYNSDMREYYEWIRNGFPSQLYSYDTTEPCAKGTPSSVSRLVNLLILLPIIRLDLNHDSP